MSSYQEFEEGRVKHLELIQDVVRRLGNDGFLMKGWGLTVAGAFLGFAVESRDAWLAAASILPTLVFWGLDAYFLRAERLFRKLYDCIRKPELHASVEPFFMSATSDDFTELLTSAEKRKLSWWATLWRPTLKWFYVAVIIAAGAVVLVLSFSPSERPSPRPSPSTSP